MFSTGVPAIASRYFIFIFFLLVCTKAVFITLLKKISPAGKTGFSSGLPDKTMPHFMYRMDGINNL